MSAAPDPGAPPAAELLVRPARIEDLREVVDVLADGSRHPEGGDLAPYAAAFARIVADRHQTFVVADLGGQVVGTLQLTLIPGLTRRGATRAQVGSVRTLSALRGRGIGEALLSWAVGEARARGASVLQLTSHTQRGNAHRFYERLGFVPSHVGFTLALREAP